MSSNLENNDKILKIFSTVRCMNRDQLPRYLDGRLTDLEKHLLEQHLVDCDLCFDALQTLSQAKHREQYQPLSVNIQQYIRNSVRKVSTTQKVERYQRLEQKKESLLIYFWVVAAVALGAGGFYLVQHQNRFRAMNPVQQIAAADKETEPIQTSHNQPVVQATEAAATTAHAAPVADTLQRRPPVPGEVKPIPVVKKDTIQTASAPVAPKPAPSKDSVKKTPPAEQKDDKSTLQQAKKEEKSTLQPAKETPAPVAEKKETPPAPKKEKDKDDDDDKKTADVQPTGTDEFLYKAAMVYHQQGDLNEAISRYKHLSDSKSKYGELSRYQLAVCYRSKGQTGKARRMFKEVVRMNGPMKDKAQSALDSL